MSPKGHNTDLAGLLDGELQDKHAVEQINSAIMSDPELMAEFEEQRGIKSLLGELDEYEAPAFMATRVMGEINARRNARRRAFHWRQALSAIGGVAVIALCVMAFGGRQHDAAGVNANSAMNGGLVANEQGTDYAPASWTQPEFGKSIENENLRNLLEFASDAHRQSELEHVASSASPNIDDLVLMVGDQGGNN